MKIIFGIQKSPVVRQKGYKWRTFSIINFLTFKFLWGAKKSAGGGGGADDDASALQYRYPGPSKYIIIKSQNNHFIGSKSRISIGLPAVQLDDHF